MTCAPRSFTQTASVSAYPHPNDRNARLESGPVRRPLGVSGALVGEEGDAVTVLYPPGRPYHGIVDSSHELRDGPLAVGAFGLLLAGVGALLWRARI